MSRYAPYLGGVAAVIVCFAVFVNSGVGELQKESEDEVEVRFVSTQPQQTGSTSSLRTAVKLTATQIAPAETAFDTTGLAVASTSLRQAVVNIICYAPADSGLHSISGSGVIVSPTGMILTNAHIAQYYLFEHRGVSCDIRTGSPAVSAYRAALAFISPAWIQANATLLTQASPMGTGEGDFAVLAITESVHASSSSIGFPFVPLASLSPGFGQPVVIASYGAQFLDTNQIKNALYPTLVASAVKNIFTFSTNTPDVLAFGGSAAAQEGSSGGGVVNARGNLVGIITTSKLEGVVADRAVSAITTTYLRAEYLKATGRTLEALLAQSGRAATAGFAPYIEPLRATLENAITKR